MQNSNPMPLKYLFTVEYLDGTTFQQNPEDVSFQDPQRSAFYDVDVDKVKRFSLSDGADTYSVDLTDGHFEVNGKKLWMHDMYIDKFRLIFFRRHKHFINQEVKDGEITGSEEVGHTIAYRLGWQGNEKSGKNIQQ